MGITLKDFAPRGVSFALDEDYPLIPFDGGNNQSVKSRQRIRKWQRMRRRRRSKLIKLSMWSFAPLRASELLSIMYIITLEMYQITCQCNRLISSMALFLRFPSSSSCSQRPPSTLIHSTWLERDFDGITICGIINIHLFVFFFFSGSFQKAFKRRQKMQIKKHSQWN